MLAPVVGFGMPSREIKRRPQCSAVSWRRREQAAGNTTDVRFGDNAPHTIQILDSNLPPDSTHFWRVETRLGGAFGYLYWGISHGIRTTAA